MDEESGPSCSHPPQPSQISAQELWIKAKNSDGKVYYCKYALVETTVVLPSGAKAFYGPKTPVKTPMDPSSSKPPHVRNLNINNKIPWKRKRSGDAKMMASAAHDYRPSSTPDTVIELSSDGEDNKAATPVKRKRPLQTNTCKVCQKYWRAEDRRKPGELKSHYVAPCKIHGHKHRPPSTPENFWKQAHLSPPETPEPDSPKKRPPTPRTLEM